MNIIIVNTSCANFSSVVYAIKNLGYNPQISYDPKVISNADKILIPGVGTANSAMHQLKKYNLINIIKKYKKPILGICLGMQLLGMYSDENHGVNTIGVIQHKTILLKSQYMPLPHMGWNTVNIKINNNILFQDIPTNSYFYFVHSYNIPVNNYTIATCTYNQNFTAALQKNNFYGVQFHPERSGALGRQLLKNFLEIK